MALCLYVLYITVSEPPGVLNINYFITRKMLLVEMFSQLASATVIHALW